jgi:hypothetical protein
VETAEHTSGGLGDLKKMRQSPQMNFSSAQNAAMFGKKCDELANNVVLTGENLCGGS